MLSAQQEACIKRVELFSGRSFAAITADFDTMTGSMPEGLLDAEIALSQDVKDFERRMQTYTGKSGFARLLTADYEALLQAFGKTAKVRVYTISDPLWPLAVMWHETEAALHASITLVICETENEEVKLAYELPSSRMRRYRNAELSALALEMDKKLAAFTEQLVRAEPATPHA